ncbi:MAG: SAM-dependent methyltransferase, partial [Mesorhizobium sp.]
MTGSDDARKFYAKLMAAHARSADPRIEEVFASVPREAFLGPGPWTVFAGDGGFKTPTADPSYIYQNVLVVLDADKGINNGEPVLHAMWIGKVEPKPGEAVTHIGAGTGYYTALLARLVEPGGSVTAFEIEADLAAQAKVNLAAYGNVGVIAPPATWLRALKPGGRLIFPWRPAERIGLAVLVTRMQAGFVCQPFMGSWFIPCVGASLAGPEAKVPTRERALRTRSIWLSED